MFPRDPTSPPTFSVHAEFTISHPGADDPRNRPRTSTERDEATGGLRMTYTWQPDWNVRARSEDRTSEGGGAKRDVWPTSASNSNKSVLSDTPSSAPTLTPPGSLPPKITPPSAMFSTDYTRGYQKGNLFFTSTPPPKTPTDTLENAPITRNIPKDFRLGSMVHSDPISRGLIHDSSGYGSDFLSPNSQAGSLPRRTHQPYDRKCRSTCNITLSTNVAGSQEPLGMHSQCGRTQSLRCQTPLSSIPTNPSRFYGCGDPWCHHLRQGDEFSGACRIPPVPEEDVPILATTKAPSRSNTYSVADRGSTKKDACVQTFEMVDKCTSPFSRMNSTESMDGGKNVKRYQRRGLTEPISRRNHTSPGGNLTPDSLENVKQPKRLVRSPKLCRLPFDRRKDNKKEQSPAQQKPNDNQKKPRTVHIDVYCTGTEVESGASSDSSDGGSKTASTPQTVFENKKMRITHRRAGQTEIPFFLRKYFPPAETSKPTPQVAEPVQAKVPSDKEEEKKDEHEAEEEEEEDASTKYPSKMSSYSNIGDLSASISSVPRSWTTYSMSSCAIPEDFDSVANTSWKDTYSDIESVLMSRSSLATESLDFVPRHLNNTQSIDEAPELSFERKQVLDTPSVASIQPSDSFEYANSDDKFRIRQMEESWTNRGLFGTRKSPVSEEKLRMQQKRIQEYMDKKIQDKTRWASKDSDSDSDDSGNGWMVIKGHQQTEPVTDEVKKVDENIASPTTTDHSSCQRCLNNPLPNTVRDAFLRSVSPQKIPSPDATLTVQRGDNEGFLNMSPEPITKPHIDLDPGSLSDSSPSTRSPNSLSFKQRFSLDPTLRSPFMIVPGIYTEPRAIATKFGTVVNRMKKPGHHVGPAKNPDCLCDHCQAYWDSVNFRTRTRSMGDPPNGKYVRNWKDLLEGGSGDGLKKEQSPFSDF